MVLKNEHHLNIDLNLDHQISLGESNCWYSNNCLHFLKCGAPFIFQNDNNFCHHFQKVL